MNNYILLPIVGVGMLLIAALISNMIKFEGGANPKDAGKRKVVFWLFFLLNPGVAYAVGLLTSPHRESLKRNIWIRFLLV